jgi:outer membrane protein TolC
MRLHRRSIPRLAIVTLVALAIAAPALRAQDKVIAAPGAPVAAVPWTLDECIQVALVRQPALAAARASLAAAQESQQGLANLPLYARCLAKDLPERRQQACLGVTAATAALWQAEWDARYAVTRNYFSFVYARTQYDLLDGLIGKLEKGRKKAADVLKSGVPGKVTKIDIELLAINIDLLRVRQVEAKVGVEKATAALREAIGLGAHDPLAIAPGALPAPLAGLDKDAVVHAALANRGEVTQASSALSVTELEITAQSHKGGLKVNTFASGSDIHAQPIPQGVANGEYRPGAIGLEMPPMLVGKRNDRVARAAALSQRAGAVVDKTANLITLEAENGYYKWLEAKDRLDKLTPIRPHVLKVADQIEDRLMQGNASGSDYLQTIGLADQVQAQYNEALYQHALALAALERITAGGFRLYPGKHP